VDLILAPSAISIISMEQTRSAPKQAPLLIDSADATALTTSAQRQQHMGRPWHSNRPMATF
jgi:hypothetical protein